MAKVNDASGSIHQNLIDAGCEAYTPIQIGNHVWIGSNATILAGVTIGD